MSSIDVLLQAADFLERQQQFSSLSSSYESSSGGGTTSSLANSRVVSLSPYFLASSSLSPPLSSASSTSSSCFGSPSGSRGSGTATTDNNTVENLSSSSPLEIKHFHKKFSPSKGLDPQVLTSKFSFSSSQSNGNASASASSSSSAAAAYHNVLYPSPSSSISSDCSNSGSGFGGSSSSSSSTKLKLKTNSHSGIVSGSGNGCSSSLDRMDDAKRDKALHNTLEKNRRAHLKDCFENLQNELPQYKDKKATNLAILNYTVKYIDACHRKNRDYEREKAMLLKRQNLLKQALEQLVTDIKMNDKDFDLKKWQATSASNTSSNNSSYSGANDLKSDYLAKVDLQMKSSSSVNGENTASFASDYLDDSTASTSTASEANDYATIDSRAKRNIIHNKSSGASSLNAHKPLVSLKYHRKRSSNSLNLPSINIGNIHMNNNKPPVIATKIIKLDEHPTSSQVKISRGGEGGMASNRQRHYSVDESMIKSKQRKRQINICDDTTEDDLLEYDEDEDEEFDYEYDDEDEEMATSMDEMDNDDSENELVINEDATNNNTVTPPAPPATQQKIVKLQTFNRSISNNSNESSINRSSPSLDLTNGSIKSSSLNGNLENLKLVLNENTTRHSQKPILSLNASHGAQYIITSNQNNNTSNSVLTGGGNKQIQIINKSTATTTSSSGGHSFNHPSLQVKHHPYAFTTTSSNNNTQQNQHLTDSALKYQINVGQK